MGTHVNDTVHVKMALFANTCDDFIASILERVAKDYNLNLKELTAKYKEKPRRRGVPKKKIVPVHNHPLCLEIQEQCPLCQSHGNVMGHRELEYEIV